MIYCRLCNEIYCGTFILYEIQCSMQFSCCILRWFAWGGLIRNIRALVCACMRTTVKKSRDIYPAECVGLSVCIQMAVLFLLLTFEMTMETCLDKYLIQTLVLELVWSIIHWINIHPWYDIPRRS